MASFLLDTHVLIWAAENPDNISQAAAQVIENEHRLYLSHASVWEMAIKIRTDKLKLEMSLDQFVKVAMAKHQLALLPIKIAHIYQTQQLPLYHRDPFDRLLIAQSMVERMPVISADAQFDAYSVQRIW